MKQIKVCGLTNNIESTKIAAIPEVDFIGFIFAEQSPRFTQESIPSFGKQRVGVFVNASLETIETAILQHQLTAVQLHGDETPDFCTQLPNDILVIKAFGIATKADLEATDEYHNVVDYFLFDTKSSKRGGSGTSFDWEILEGYQGPRSFFLSGGIGLDTLVSLRHFDHPLCIGYDLNSRFETTPKVKNVQLIEIFIQQLQHENSIVS
ncbi:MAG: phosphoribosylanthranilate isomerase [Bacteroidota bacterium]